MGGEKGWVGSTDGVGSDCALVASLVFVVMFFVGPSRDGVIEGFSSSPAYFCFYAVIEWFFFECLIDCLLDAQRGCLISWAFASPFLAALGAKRVF